MRRIELQKVIPSVLAAEQDMFVVLQLHAKSKVSLPVTLRGEELG